MSPLDLSDASADRRETLPHDGKLNALYNAARKTREACIKKWGPKHAKFAAILYNFRL